MMGPSVIGRHPMSTVSVSGYQTTRQYAARELRRMRHYQQLGIIRIYKMQFPHARQYVSTYTEPSLYNWKDTSRRTFDQVVIYSRRTFDQVVTIT